MDKMPELEDMFEVNFVEDCLYLNIFVPQNSANTLKTVMVCILYKKKSVH
jgi:carboxylesterase type B